MIDINRVKGFVLGLVACAIITLLLGSCRTTKYVPVESTKTRTEYKTLAVHDTVRDTVLKHNNVYKHDSVIVTAKGDTVFVDRWHTLMQVTVDKGKTLHSNVVHDTIYINKADSVTVPEPVERQLTKWEKANNTVKDIFSIIGMIVTLMVIAFVVLWLIKRKKE